jgi:hypothetical protein
MVKAMKIKKQISSQYCFTSDAFLQKLLVLADELKRACLLNSKQKKQYYNALFIYFSN